ncbi:MAG TPA: response regulator transcription factor [Nocardioides sp.]|uniref:response regulator transcription factor n=1 Tax=Nocardioides sp. TaxID=35761 RepID=UPI002F40C65B
MATVGVCEDEPGLRSVLTRALRNVGHEVQAVALASEAMRAFRETPPQVLILDIGLPDGDGRDLCLALRASGVDAPVLFLTARDGLHDKVAGFEAGGDDYLSKPFELEELRVRLDALLRRRTPVASVPADQPLLDGSRHALTRGDREVTLSPTEFRLLGRLMAQPGQVVRRHTLVAAAWPMGGQVSDNTLDSYVRRIRRKLDDVGGGAITTLRGVGYRWQ